MPRIFISHSSRDNQIAAEIKTWLDSRGFDNVFLDIDKHAGIPPGKNWEQELYRGIDSAQAVILLVTPNWHASKWCFVEFAQARALGKPIFPVIIAPGGERFIAPDIQQLDLQLDREGGLDRLAAELTRIALDAQAGFEWSSRRPPYPGLLSFEKEDAAVFFGRDDDIRRVIERLNARRVQGTIKLVALLGASGSGKSSVIRAGLLPRLEHDTQSWIALPPFRPRRDPISEFARAASDALGTPEEWRVWRERFVSLSKEGQVRDLADALRVRAGAREAQILVTIDQGEELFSVTEAELRKPFFELLRHLTAEHEPFIVLMALRSDYLGPLQETTLNLPFDELSLGPFPLSRVRQIIEGPARVAGLRVEDGLVESALADMGTDDALPLLAFTLRELYDRLDRNSSRELSLAHYRMLGDPASGLNPLENAVRKRADQVVDDLRLSDAALGALREAFVGSMVRVDEEGQYMRRPASWDDLPTPALPVLEKLADARLLIIRTDAGAKTVEAAHEALLRKWPRLRAWLDAERDFLVGKAQLRYATEDWQHAAANDKDQALLRGLPLIRARQWLNDHARALTAEEKEYIEKSIVQDEAETTRKARRRQMAWGGAAIVVLLAGAILFLVREQQAAGIRAESTALAIQARSSLATDPIRAAAWSAEATGKHSSAEALSILLESVIALSPHLLKALNVSDLRPAVVAWAADSSGVAVGGEGKVVRWQLGRPKSVMETTIAYEGGRNGARSPTLALSWSDGVTGVFANGETTHLRESSQGTVTASALPMEQVAKASIGMGGRRLLIASASDPDIKLFDCMDVSAAGKPACTGRSVASVYATALALDDHGALAAIGSAEGALKIVAFGRSQSEEPVELDDQSRIVALAWTRDSSRLAVGTVSGRALVFDRHGRMLIEAVRGADSVTAVAWDPSGTRLASACGSFSICLWRLSATDAADGSLQFQSRLIGHKGLIRALDWSPDGRMIASVAEDGTVRIWSVDMLDRTSFSLDAGDDVALTDLDVSHDGQWLAAGDARGRVHFWSLSRLQPEAPLDNGQDTEIKQLAWSPRGPTLAIGDTAGEIAIRNWPDGRKPKTIHAAGPIEALRWLPGGAAIVTAGALDGSIITQSIDSDQSQGFDQKHPDAVVGLAIDRDGKRLLSADTLGNLWDWDLSTRKRSGAFASSGASRDTVAISHDGRRAVVAGNDGDVVIYQLDSSQAQPIRCHSGSRQLDGAVFAPDDALVAAVSAEGILHLWSLSERCEILASASLSNFVGRAFRSGPAGMALRRRLILVPTLSALAITMSTGEVMLISITPQTWLTRARSVSEQK